MYDEVYSIGCFDHFHYGHKNILNYMKTIGKKLIIGVHDDESIRKLKNLSKEEHDIIDVRIKNVKKYADQVYVIPSTKPDLFLECMINKENNKKVYIRADDMKQFPGRNIVEDNNIDILFAKYTKGISSTLIRKNLKLN